MTDEEKRIRQRGYCKTYYQKNKERIKAKRQGNTAWLALEQAERDWKNNQP